MKRPAFQFYPADWRKDAGLQSCSISARGLWIEMMCIMHEGGVYGHLEVNGRPMTAAQLARLVGETEKTVKPLLDELEQAGVFSVNEQGVIFCRRMVRDEHVRNVRAEGGKGGKDFGKLGAEHGAKGGRPSKGKGGLETPLKTPLTDGKEPPPSSSSSSSSSSSNPKTPSDEGVQKPPSGEGPLSPQAAPRATRLPKGFTLPDEWRDWAQDHCATWTTGHITVIFESFRDFWIAKSGKDAAKNDWFATWRNWCRREAQTKPRGNGGSNVTDFRAARKAEEDAVWEEFMNRGSDVESGYIEGEFTHG